MTRDDVLDIAIKATTVSMETVDRAMLALKHVTYENTTVIADGETLVIQGDNLFADVKVVAQAGRPFLVQVCWVMGGGAVYQNSGDDLNSLLEGCGL